MDLYERGSMIDILECHDVTRSKSDRLLTSSSVEISWFSALMIDQLRIRKADASLVLQ